MLKRTLCLAALLLSGTALAQDKTLTFDNASPAKTVHLLNGTSVSIGTTGNLVAKCVLASSGGNCADLPTGGGTGGGTPPSLGELVASNFSTSPTGGLYNAGTTFTLTANVTGASVCWRHVTQGPVTSNWSGAITAGFNTGVTGILLGQASTTYTFRIDCYNTDGGVSKEYQVSTGTVVGPPPAGECPDPNWVPTLADYGFTQQNTPNIWLQLQGMDTFPDSNIFSNQILVPKSTLSGLVFLGSDRAKYISVKFTTPASSSGGDFAFNASQVPGTSAAVKGSYYLTISRCPGDLRYNIPNPTEPSEGQACKNIRKPASGGTPSKLEGIRWNLSNTINDGFLQATCGLAPNTTYYLNYANVNPDDGFIQSEHLCPNNVSSCGVQFKSN